jgi:hypothetical protein
MTGPEGNEFCLIPSSRSPQTALIAPANWSGVTILGAMPAAPFAIGHSARS